MERATGGYCDSSQFRSLRRLAQTEVVRAPGRTIRVGNLEVTPGDPQIFVDGRSVFVSAQELSMLELLAQRAGRVVRTTELARFLSRGRAPLTGTGVAVYVHRLRARLTETGVRIRTLRGFGYLLEATGVEHEP